MRLADKRRKFRAFETNKQAEQTEAQEGRRYYHGKQWTEAEKARLTKRRQPIVTDNRISRKVDFLVGIEQRMRRDPKCYGRTPQHDQQADLATASVRFVCDLNRWENIGSNGAHDGMVSGYGVAWVGVETKRGQPEVSLKAIDPDRFSMILARQRQISLMPGIWAFTFGWTLMRQRRFGRTRRRCCAIWSTRTAI